MVHNSIERLVIHAWKRPEPGQQELSYQGTANGHKQTGTPLDSPSRGQVQMSLGIHAQAPCSNIYRVRVRGRPSQDLIGLFGGQPHKTAHHRAELISKRKMGYTDTFLDWHIKQSPA